MTAIYARTAPKGRPWLDRSNHQKGTQCDRSNHKEASGMSEIPGEREAVLAAWRQQGRRVA